VGKFRAAPHEGPSLAISRSTRGGKEASPLPEDQRIGAPQADPAHGDGVLAEVDEQLPLPRPVDHVILLSYTIASSHSLWLGTRKGSVSWRERGKALHLHQCDGSWLPGYVAFSPKFWCNAKTWGEGGSLLRMQRRIPRGGRDRPQNYEEPLALRSPRDPHDSRRGMLHHGRLHRGAPPATSVEDACPQGPFSTGTRSR